MTHKQRSWEVSVDDMMDLNDEWVAITISGKYVPSTAVVRYADGSGQPEDPSAVEDLKVEVTEFGHPWFGREIPLKPAEAEHFESIVIERVEAYGY